MATEKYTRFLKQTKKEKNMTKPKFLIARYFVNNDATLQGLHNGITDLECTEYYLKKEDQNYTVGLKLTINKLDVRLREQVKKEINRLSPSLWFMLDPVDRGPGTSTLQVQLNPTFDSGILINVDLDQFEIETRKGLESIMTLVEDVEKNGHLYAVGSRNVPVRLGKYPSNSRLREIHELFHSCAIGSELLRVENHPEGVSPGYAAIGESTTGLTVIDHTHKQYPNLVARVTKASQSANFRTPAAEYYISIASSELGTRGKGYVLSRINPFPNEIEEEKERNSFITFIEGQTRELAKTDILKKMFPAISLKSNHETILNFYSKEETLTVIKLMQKGLTR